MHAHRKNSDGEAANESSRSSIQAASLHEIIEAHHNHVKQPTYQANIPTDV